MDIVKRFQDISLERISWRHESLEAVYIYASTFYFFMADGLKISVCRFRCGFTA